jgi:thioester reductase-like protein
MNLHQGILLTGATGLLGRYLLRDLLAYGNSVSVLIREAPAETATERLNRLLVFAEESLHRKLPRPTLLNGDLAKANLGLGTVERSWLARNTQAVLHSAAYVSYRPTPEGEPWETNVHGTRRLLELCRASGCTELHHLSTAFLCGDRRGILREDELDCGSGSGNAYEQSKFAAEQLVRGFPGIRATIYRPAVIVGDSRTGYTSTYHHFYRFLELGVRLSAPRSQAPPGNEKLRRQRLPLRLPLTGNETQNLVPVDWVSQAILALLHRPQWHGRTFHLVARQPIRLQEIKEMIEDLLHIEGIRWAGRGELANPTTLEQLILEQFQDYWSYLDNDLVFDCWNTQQALPDLPPPSFDRELVVRLLRYAQEDNWGRGRRGQSPPALDLAHYLEHVLPEKLSRSPMADALPPRIVFALDIRSTGGGTWSCRWADGRLNVRRGVDAETIVTYRMASSVFETLLRGWKSPQQAFFDGQIEIDGDVEKALKLALFIERFLADSPDRLPGSTEAVHAGVGI